MQTQQPSQVVITAAARSNDAFRREVMTGDHQQVVLMTIPPGGEIGDEVHPDRSGTFVRRRRGAYLGNGRSSGWPPKSR